jgi:hypothetical protein
VIERLRELRERARVYATEDAASGDKSHEQRWVSLIEELDQLLEQQARQQQRRGPPVGLTSTYSQAGRGKKHGS